MSNDKSTQPIQDFDVAIVGYGPSGMVAASTLAQAGHRVVILERWPTSYGLPRLSHIDGETARIVAASGDIEHALRDAATIDFYDYRNAQGDLLIRLDWRGKSSGFPAHISMFQPDIEDAIDRTLLQLPNVTFFKGWRVDHVEQDLHGVTLAARPTPGTDHEADARLAVRAKFVIGADGAKSFIREAIGIERDDFGNNERWLNVDSELLHDLGDRFKVMAIFCDPARAHMLMPIGTKRIRFEVRVLPGESNSQWDTLDAGLRWLKDKHGLGPEDIRPLRNIVYTFETRVARTWSAGRIFLIGDAAHTMMPYMGQGACSGMRDGINLGWKLDLVLSGRSDTALLATYEEERRPHVGTITAMTTFLGKVTNEDDPEKAAARDQAFRTNSVPPMPPFPRIEAGVVDNGGAGPLHPAVGHPAPQGQARRAGREGRMNELLDRGFYLVARTDPRKALSAPDLDFFDRLGCQFVILDRDANDKDGIVEIEPVQQDFLDKHGFEAYLVRPDFLVYGGSRSEGELRDLIQSLKARLCWSAA